jgi:hypothetical protein
MNVVQLLQDSAAVQPPLITIEGRRLVLSGRTKTQRALLLRDIANEKIRVVNFTIRQLAAIVGVSPTYGYAAAHLQADDCDAVWRGERPLIPPKKVPAPPLSPRERINQVIAEIGFDATLTLLAEQQSAAVAA